MASNRYPLTLHHPSIPDVTTVVADKKSETAWRDAGWRVTELEQDKTEDPAPAATGESSDDSK